MVTKENKSRKRRIREDYTARDEIRSSTSLSEYVMGIRKAMNDETTAISIYDDILSMSDLPSSSRPVIEEILNDEKDHLVLLSRLFKEAVARDLPNNGDEYIEGATINETSPDESDE